MELRPSALNQQLAEAVENRVAAELSYISGQSGFWRAIGIGICAFGLGTGIGLGFYGYSFITRNTDNLGVLTDAFSKSLSDIQLKGNTVGTVDIQPHELRLANNQTISLDESSRIRLDPLAKIFVEGDVKVQTPTVSVPQTVTPRAKTATPTITNFTVFKAVPFEKGSVQTGWMFLTSAQKSPTTQYCYYTESGENPDVSLRVEVGTDGQIEDKKNIPSGFDGPAAFSKCVWFRKDTP
jgi:hypothetical protein